MTRVASPYTIVLIGLMNVEKLNTQSNQARNKIKYKCEYKNKQASGKKCAKSAKITEKRDTIPKN